MFVFHLLSFSFLFLFISALTEPQLPVSSFNRVLRAISHPVHDFAALVTPEALSCFPFQPQFVEDVVSGASGVFPEVKLVRGTTTGTYHSGT